MNKLPIARSADIVVQTLDKEILIYDLNNHKAYNLNETSSIVYQACDGRTTFDELKRVHKFTDDLIFLALDQLRADNLIKTDNSFASPFSGMSRREAIRNAGLASMIALPVISSLAAPSATMAQSCQPNQFNFGSITVNGEICGGNRQPADQASRNAACNAQFGAQCCSRTARSEAGTCSFNGAQSTFECRCGPALA